MMLMCPECGNPLDEYGFTNCGGKVKGSECELDRGMFLARVEQIKRTTSLQALAKMEENQMPQCFTPTREAIVALAAMLMTAMRQNQEMAERLRVYTKDLH
jgi:hypothetical protein